MRHLGSLVLCLVVGAVVYVLAGISDSKWVEGESTSGADRYGALALALAAALVAGGLYGLLVLARLSPIGTVLTGLLFLTVGIWSSFSLSSFADLVPNDIFGIDNAGVRASGPLSLIISMPLLLTLFSPRRWRRWGSAPAAVAPAPGYTPPPVAPNSYQSPTSPSPSGYPSPTSPSPTYQSPSAPSYGAPSYGSPTYSPSYNSPVSPAFGGPPEPSGVPPLPPPPSPYASGGDDPEATRRL
jgi:hypothetical protein